MPRYIVQRTFRDGLQIPGSLGIGVVSVTPLVARYAG